MTLAEQYSKLSLKQQLRKLFKLQAKVMKYYIILQDKPTEDDNYLFRGYCYMVQEMKVALNMNDLKGLVDGQTVSRLFN